MSKGKKIALIALIVVAVFIIAVAVLVPLLFNVDRYRPQVVQRLQEETGKPVSIGRLTLHILPRVAIRVENFSMGNPAGFPQGDVVKARDISAVVDAGALWDRRVVIESLTLDDPVLNLLQTASGKWNFENPPAPAKPKGDSDGGPSSFTLGVISKVIISNAQMKAANLLASGREGPAYFQGQGVTLELQQVDLNAFTASATLRLPQSQYPGVLARLLFWQPSVAFAADQRPPAAQGTLKADSLSFSNLQVTSVQSKLRLYPRQVFFDDLNFDLYDGHSAGGLDFNFAGRNPRYSTNAKLSGVNMEKLLNAFPQGRGKMTGTMDGNVKLAGEIAHSDDPLAGMQGVGKVNVKNGRLPSLNLNKNLMMLAKLSNLGAAQGDPSSFSSMSSDFNIGGGRLTSNNISIIGNGVDIDAAGALTMAGAGSLDYLGNAKLEAGQSPVSGLLSGLTGATMENGKLKLPFGIGGTMDNPRFILKSLGSSGQMNAIQGLMGGQQGAQSGQQQPSDLVQGISGLFKKKKQP
ncbi:MAG TPA: AsmA family protein [Terriglobia bacterium]|nr:AsmA family protein [Terriglobia bacterium]